MKPISSIPEPKAATPVAAADSVGVLAMAVAAVESPVSPNVRRHMPLQHFNSRAFATKAMLAPAALAAVRLALTVPVMSHNV